MPNIPASISEESPQAVVEQPLLASTSTANTDYFGLNRQSPTDSVEPDTMSSSNVSETSECESDDSDPEPLKSYWAKIGGHFVVGEDEWEDEDEVKSDGAVNHRPAKEKEKPFVTSSQEELSIIDYQVCFLPKYLTLIINISYNQMSFSFGK